MRGRARDELFTKDITPEPAEEGSPVWAKVGESDDDEDGTPPHVDADELELIAMPPAPTSAPPTSNLERCIALRLVYGAGPCYYSRRNKFERFRGFLELISRFEFEFCRRENYFF